VHVLAAFSISPVGVGDSVGDAVAAIVEVVRASGLPNETTAMYTTVEGEPDEVFALLRRCIEVAEGFGPRVSAVIKIDHRPGHTDTLRSKVERVEAAITERAAVATTDQDVADHG
jgi:uncharacterized protein (TIGR00106 family)